TRSHARRGRSHRTFRNHPSPPRRERPGPSGSDHSRLSAGCFSDRHPPCSNRSSRIPFQVDVASGTPGVSRWRLVMREWWRSLFTARAESASLEMDEVRPLRDGFISLDDESLKRAARSATRLPEIVAVTAVVASRVLGLQMFDAQLAGALALAHRWIVEVQTGEGQAPARAA